MSLFTFCPKTGVVLEIPLLNINHKTGKVIFDNKGEKLETNILNGNCKLQWKVDWVNAMVYICVDFEMYGKDLTESAMLSNKICRILGKAPPNGFAYELFLDEKGEKISKSKGNGISIEEWLRYASPESLALYMYLIQREQKNYIQKWFQKPLMNTLILISINSRYKRSNSKSSMACP